LNDVDLNVNGNHHGPNSSYGHLSVVLWTRIVHVQASGQVVSDFYIIAFPSAERYLNDFLGLKDEQTCGFIHS